MNTEMRREMDLFGESLPYPVGQKRLMKYFDYEGFVEKFKPKHTTDDCNTPPKVYDAVVGWLRDQGKISSERILRPFYPGGDYQKEDYTGDCVVVDNPPFSVFSSITRWYVTHGVRFFLFAPHLTLFKPNFDCTYVIVDASVTYHNGASVRTSFVSNLFGDILILGAPDLSERIYHAQRSGSKKKLIIHHPPNIITTSKIAKLVNRGKRVVIYKGEAEYLKNADGMKAINRQIYGSAFIVPNRVVAELESLDPFYSKTDKTPSPYVDFVEYELSEREAAIVEALDRRSRKGEGSSPTTKEGESSVEATTIQTYHDDNKRRRSVEDN